MLPHLSAAGGSAGRLYGLNIQRAGRVTGGKAALYFGLIGWRLRWVSSYTSQGYVLRKYADSLISWSGYGVVLSSFSAYM